MWGFFLSGLSAGPENRSKCQAQIQEGYRNDISGDDRHIKKAPFQGLENRSLINIF